MQGQQRGRTVFASCNLPRNPLYSKQRFFQNFAAISDPSAYQRKERRYPLTTPIKAFFERRIIMDDKLNAALEGIYDSLTDEQKEKAK